jgi:hypothetical protein
LEASDNRETQEPISLSSQKTDKKQQSNKEVWLQETMEEAKESGGSGGGVTNGACGVDKTDSCAHCRNEVFIIWLCCEMDVVSGITYAVRR